jgi:glycosyltransferase involved in cell wall biosynthesis
VLREFLADGRDCRMVPVGDAGALGAALVETMTDPALRVHLIDAGRITSDRFTWDAAAAAHEAVYARVGAPA